MYTYSHMCGTYRRSSIWRSEVSVVLLFLFSETRFLMEHGWNSWLRQTGWPLIPMEMRLLSPMHQHCGYRWVLPPWLLYECWGPEFRPHANAVSPSPGEPSLQLVLSFLILNVFILKVIYTDKFNILTTLKLFFAMSPWNQHRCATPLCEAESLLPIPAGSSDHTSLTLLHVFPQRNHHSVSLISLTSLGQF